MRRVDAASIGAFMDWLLSVKGRALMVLLDEQSEEDLRHVLTHPLTALGSDAWAVRLGEGRPHPRAYGMTARLLGRFVQDERLLGLEEAVRKMTAAPEGAGRAERFSMFLFLCLWMKYEIYG